RLHAILCESSSSRIFRPYFSDLNDHTPQMPIGGIPALQAAAAFFSPSVITIGIEGSLTISAHVFFPASVGRKYAAGGVGFRCPYRESCGCTFKYKYRLFA